ncbi:ATP-grasp domain-containing protein [Magnetococcales bacterium HHB-1]
MSRPKIAVFANHHSPQAEAVREMLFEEGATPLLFDIRLGGEREPEMTLGPDKAVWEGIDFKEIHAVHIRCTAPNVIPALPPLLNAASHAEMRTAYLKEQHYFSTVASFFEGLKSMGKLVVNPLTHGYVDHDTKAQLYEKLRDQGFPTPATCMTDNPERAAQFLRTHGEAVIKPSIGIGSTRIVSEKDMARLEEVRQAPIMFQQRVKGDTLRVHIVGDEVVLALRIITDGGVDSRTSTKDFKYTQLPEEEAKRIVKATRSLGLHYAAWDIIETEDQQYAYLDCNPGPFVMWIGRTFIREVFRQLARYMITYAQTQSIEAASAQVTPYHP